MKLKFVKKPKAKRRKRKGVYTNFYATEKQIASYKKLVERAKKLDKNLKITISFLCREGLSHCVNRYNRMLDKVEAGEFHAKKRPEQKLKK